MTIFIYNLEENTKFIYYLTDCVNQKVYGSHNLKRSSNQRLV